MQPEKVLLSSGADAPGDDRAQDTAPGQAVTSLVAGDSCQPCPHRRRFGLCPGFYVLPHPYWMGTASVNRLFPFLL